MAGTSNGQGGVPSAAGPGPYYPQQQMQQPQAQPNVFQTSAQAYNQAVGAAGQAGQPVNPAQYSAAEYGAQGYDPRTVQHTPSLRGRSLQGYMNPYTNQVINRAQGDLRRQNRMAVNDLDAAASAAGAFGGSRHGVAQSLTNAEFGDTMADMSAGLRMSGFQNAQNAAMFDATNRLNNRQFNAQQINQARSQNANAATAAASQNAGFQNAARSQNAGFRQQARMAQPGMDLNRAAALGNLSQAGFNMGTQLNDRTARDGMMQQALSQGVIDAARGQWGGYTGAPGQGLAQLMGAVGGVPYGQSNTASQRPGLLNLLSLGLSL